MNTERTKEIEKFANDFNSKIENAFVTFNTNVLSYNNSRKRKH